MEDRRRLLWFQGLISKQEEGKVTVDKEYYTKNNASAVSNGSMQTLKNSSWFEFETSDSTKRRQRSGPKDLEKLGWITFVSDNTDEARHQVHSQHSVQTQECTNQSTLAL